MKLGAPQADELGFAKSLRTTEIGGTQVILLEQDASAGAVSTVVLRASTEQLLDDLERAVDDGVNTYKVRALPMGMFCMSGLERACNILSSSLASLVQFQAK